MRFLEGKFTPHIIVIGLSSIVLLALSIALLVLEARVQDAFRDQGFQYPGSSIAEFIFVPLNPSNIDLGPTIVKFAVGACSLIVSLLSIVWPVLHWCRIGGRANVVHIRMLGSAVCIAAVTNTAATIGFTVYVFTTEAQGHLPQYYKQWHAETFTQEFYICEAMPSLFPNTQDLYGFPACEKTRAGKYLLLVICCVSGLLAGISVLQAHRDGVFAVFVKTRRKDTDLERARPRRTKNIELSSRLPQQPGVVHLSSNPPHQKPEKLPKVSEWASRSRTSLHGYFAKQ